MKFLAIIGSLRQDSVNRKAAHALAKVLPDDVSMELAELHDVPLFNQDDTGEGKDLPEGIQALGNKIRDADAVIFSTPEYNYSIPGVLKNAIDWISRHPDQPFFGKAAAVIGASPGGIGTARAQYHLRQIGVFLNLHWLNKPEVMIGGAFAKFDDAGNLTDEATADHLAKFAEALQNHAKNINGGS